jgi:hypothetical protein
MLLMAAVAESRWWWKWLLHAEENSAVFKPRSNELVRTLLAHALCGKT